MGLFAVIVASPAATQEYCVACTAPDAFYRCAIDGAAPASNASYPMLCITTLAREGAHASCAVRSNVGVLDCNGPVKRVNANADGLAAPVIPSAASKPAAAQNPDAPLGDAKTVAEMLQRAKQQNERAWEKTTAQIQSNNAKVGGFFKQSWNCMTSLFLHCSEKPQ